MMKKRFGPFVVLTSTHTESYPVRDVTLKKVEGNSILCEDGVVLTADHIGVQVSFEGKRCSMHVGDRKVSVMQAAQLSPGTVITLAAPRTFGNPAVPESRRKAHIVYETFMSACPLANERTDKKAPGLNAGRGGRKYELVRDHADQDELERLKARLEKLEAENAELKAKGQQHVKAGGK